MWCSPLSFHFFVGFILSVVPCIHFTFASVDLDLWQVLRRMILYLTKFYFVLSMKPGTSYRVDFLLIDNNFSEIHPWPWLWAEFLWEVLNRNQIFILKCQHNRVLFNIPLETSADWLPSTLCLSQFLTLFCFRLREDSAGALLGGEMDHP